MSYDLLIIAAHPDDAEVQMGGTIAKLTAAGQRALIVYLCDGDTVHEVKNRGQQEQGY